MLRNPSEGPPLRGPSAFLEHGMDMQRAYSALECKEFDDEKRVIRGMATTPTPDRTNDVVEPFGVKVAPTIPLCLYHDHKMVVGTVRFGRPTSKGIPFEASLPKVAEEGRLRDRVDEAWQMVKYHLITGVSIGFKAVANKVERLKNGGLRFIESEVLELSLVPIPMNAEATITSIKSIDTELRAASGHTQRGVVRLADPPGASGNAKNQPAERGFFSARNPEKPMSIKEQIASFEAKRAAAADRMSVVMTKAADEGRTLDAAETEEYDGLSGEVKAVDDHLVRLRDMERLQVAKAVPVPQKPGEQAASDARGGFVQLKAAEKLEPGIAFARYAICLTKAKGKHDVAFKLAERYFPGTETVVRTLKAQSEGFDLQEALRVKAAVAGGTTADSTWAAPLVDAATFAGDFIGYLRPRTLIGQAQFRPVPFNVRIVGQTSGGSASWVGQGKAKPVTKFDFNATTVPFTKIAAIAVITQELARFSDPSAEALVRDSLSDSVIARLDSDLFDPDVAAVANVNPAGLLVGVSPVAGPADTDPDTIRAALLRLWAPWDSTFLGARPAYYTTPAVARLLAFARDAMGNKAFEGVTPTGGTLDGVPLRVSQYLANNGGSGGAPFILVDESEIYLADDGSVTLDATDQASVEMDGAPSSNSGSPTGASLVSMWQTNSIAFRAERFVWWGARRSGAIQWIDGFPTS